MKEDLITCVSFEHKKLPCVLSVFFYRLKLVENTSPKKRNAKCTRCIFLQST